MSDPVKYFVRPARLSDRPELVRLCRERTFHELLVAGAEQQREVALELLETKFESALEDDELRALVITPEENGESLVGYALLNIHCRESITGEAQTQITACTVSNFEMAQAIVNRSVEIAKEVEDLFLVINLAEAAKKEQMWFYRLGFRVELVRGVKVVPAGRKGPTSPHYNIRSGLPRDLPFICRVNAAYSASYLPYGRDVDARTIEAGFLIYYSQLRIRSSDWHYFIIEEVSSGKPAGYVIYQPYPQLKEPNSVYTYDIAVAPEFQGRGLSLYLCGVGETLLGEGGGGLIIGDTSPHNVAALNMDRALGGITDTKRWGLDCRP
jgi:ribosomal protein S18 acetylase RimI-like enzyme